MAKNKRLTKASVYRYAFKRIKWNLSTASGDEIGKIILGDKNALTAVVRAGLEETVNWYTDYALSHRVKAVVKRICNEEGIPGALQGVLMAFGQKVLANYFLDNKDETLANLIWDYTRKLMEFAPATKSAIPQAYLRVRGKRILIPELLRKIAIEVGAMLNVPKEKVVTASSEANLHV